MTTKYIYTGDKRLASTHVPEALNRMFQLKQGMKLGNLKQSQSPVFTLLDGSRLRVSSVYGLDKIEIWSPGVSEEVTAKVRAKIVPYIKAIKTTDVDANGFLLWSDSSKCKYIIMDWNLNPVTVEGSITKCLPLENKATIGNSLNDVEDNQEVCENPGESPPFIWRVPANTWVTIYLYHGTWTVTTTTTTRIYIDGTQILQFIGSDIWQEEPTHTYTDNCGSFYRHWDYLVDNTFYSFVDQYFGNINIGYSGFINKTRYQNPYRYIDDYTKTEDDYRYTVEQSYDPLTESTTDEKFFYINGEVKTSDFTLSSIKVGQMAGVISSDTKRSYESGSVDYAYPEHSLDTLMMGAFDYNLTGGVYTFGFAKLACFQNEDKYVEKNITSKIVNTISELAHIMFTINGLAVFEWYPGGVESFPEVNQIEFGLCIIEEAA